MNKLTILATLAVTASSMSASAATIVKNLGGPGPYNVAKFDPSLGTLNAIRADVTGGSATFKVSLDGYLAEASVPYSVSTYFGIYMASITIDGKAGNTGNALFANGVAEIVLPVIPYTVDIAVPTDPTTSNYKALIGDGTTFSTLTVDTLYSLNMPELANYGRKIQDVTLTGKSAIWSLTYDYTPFRGAVPEPSSWAMMISGLSLVGASMRRYAKRVALG